MYPKDFSVVLFLLLVGICAYLLCVGRLSGRLFVTSLIVAAFAVVLLQNADVLQRFSLKGQGMEATAEFERIKQDIYAKADAVRQMTEAVAGLIAEDVTTSNRYGGSGDPDPISQTIRYRDRLRQTLTDAGTPPDRIKQLLAPFEHWIPFDLRNALLTSVQAAARQRNWDFAKSNEFGNELSGLLNKEPYPASLSEAERKIHDAGLSSPDINLDIERYRTFLATGGPIPPKLRK
jgi:hypothetical protein